MRGIRIRGRELVAAAGAMGRGRPSGEGAGRAPAAGTSILVGIRASRRPDPVQHETRRTQILPTRSSDGARVFSPSFHLAGQTSFGWALTYWAAFTLRSSSLASRPIPPALISMIWILPA